MQIYRRGHVLYTHDSQPQYSSDPIRRGSKVEVFDGKQWIGGYEVRHRYPTFVSVLDRAEGFFGGRFDVPLSKVRPAELPDPIWRDVDGNDYRIGPSITHPLE